MAYRQITFDAGAPVDANDLNQLQDNITALFAQTNTLYNATIGQQNDPVVPAIFANTITVDGLRKDEPKVENLPIGGGFTEAPVIIATIASRLKDKEQIYINAFASGPTSATVEVKTSSGRNSVKVSYIAIQMKPVSS